MQCMSNEVIIEKPIVNNPILTIFTPTYNRAYCLEKCYKSLCRQTNKSFIWLIVDDGSEDDTLELVEQWKKESSGFLIQYIYKINGGMHTAHNVAYDNICTELNVCIDSDDYMTDDAVEKILVYWKKYGGKQYAGVIALDINEKGDIIGTKLPNKKSTTLGGVYKSGGKGDKKLIYRTEVIKNTPPYPQFEGENYVGLAYKYSLIDKQYELIIMNEPVCVVDYRQDGSSLNMFRQYRKNPNGFIFLRIEGMTNTNNPKELMRNNIHYISSSIFAHHYNFIRESPRKKWTLLSLPFGLLMNFYIRLRCPAKSIQKGNK